MEIMNAKLEKNLRGSVNRRVNCDAANLDKAVEAAQVQLEAIRSLEQSGQLEGLPDKLRRRPVNHAAGAPGGHSGGAGGSCGGGEGAAAALPHGALWVLLLYLPVHPVGAAVFRRAVPPGPGGCFFGRLFYGRGYGAVNLEPFHTIRNYIIYYRRTGSFVSVTNLLGNVVIFGAAGGADAGDVPAYAPLLDLSAPGRAGVLRRGYIQWVTATGAADVDDSILNFIGAALGYLFTRLCQITAGMIAKRRSRGE